MKELDDETEAALAAGIELFNAGKFFEAHEVWEDAWRVEVGATRAFLQGLIKVAAGLYKAERSVPSGAVKLLRGGRVLLDPFREKGFAGIDVASFVRAVAVSADAALRWELRASTDFDFSLAPKITRSG